MDTNARKVLLEHCDRAVVDLAERSGLVTERS
jgi:hypothetical protein